MLMGRFLLQNYTFHVTNKTFIAFSLLLLTVYYLKSDTGIQDNVYLLTLISCIFITIALW